MRVYGRHVTRFNFVGYESSSVVADLLYSLVGLMDDPAAAIHVFNLVSAVTQIRRAFLLIRRLVFGKQRTCASHGVISKVSRYYSRWVVKFLAGRQISRYCALSS
jgi:hypothetical protein